MKRMKITREDRSKKILSNPMWIKYVAWHPPREHWLEYNIYSMSHKKQKIFRRNKQCITITNISTVFCRKKNWNLIGILKLIGGFLYYHVHKLLTCHVNFMKYKIQTILAVKSQMGKLWTIELLLDDMC